MRRRPAVNQIDMPTIHALSGPDIEGRIAYIEDHFFVANQKNRRHVLKTIRLDGTNAQGTRSERGNHWCERIWTVIATCMQQG